MYQDFKDLLSAFHAHSINYRCLYPHFNSYTVISGGEPKRTGEKMVPMPRLT